MSELVIKGGGSGNTAAVDNLNRLNTFSVTQAQQVHSSTTGNAFFISTGIINLTTANKSEVVFIANDDTVGWVVDEIASTFGASTGGAGDFASTATIGPSTITSSSAIPAVNLNLGSPKTLSGRFLAGSEGSTPTGGIGGLPGIVPSDQISVLFNAGPVIIAPGTSASIGITPPAGNTSLNVDITVVVYRLAVIGET